LNRIISKPVINIGLLNYLAAFKLMAKPKPDARNDYGFPAYYFREEVEVLGMGDELKKVKSKAGKKRV